MENCKNVKSEMETETLPYGTPLLKLEALTGGMQARRAQGSSILTRRR